MDFSKIRTISIPEGIVVKITSGLNVLWQKLLLSRVPSEYQEVNWIKADKNVQAYIDLGFAFDTKSTIKMSQYVVDSTTTAYPFGCAENSGKLRCMLSLPYEQKASFYGSKETDFMLVQCSIVTNSFNEFVMTIEPNKLHIQNLTNSSSSNIYESQISYTMTNNLYLFAQNYNGTPRFGGVRQIGYFKYYDKNDKLICNLVPCFRKSDGVIGMYDLIRKTFLTNVGSGSFIKGTNVGNQVPASINSDGTIYNNGLGYKQGYRVRSGGAEAALEALAFGACTGFIRAKGGDVVRIAKADFLNGSIDNAINVSDSSFTNLGQIVNNNVTGYGILAQAQYVDYRWASIVEETTGVYKWIIPPADEIAYIRVTARTTDGSTLIITINEEIPL